jgi:sRNA-binding protein
MVGGFFAVRKASVFDADGNALGEGEQIIVNGAAVQMTAATRQHIEVPAAPRQTEIAPAPAAAESAESPARKQRAA